MPELVCVDLGRVSYPRAMEIQQQLLAEVRAVGGKRAYLLLAEHRPAVITLGRRGSDADVLASPEALAKAGVAVVRCSRGGGATYHGPGQLVAYPIVRLEPRCGALRQYIHSLEEAVINFLRYYGVTANQKSGRPGVWVDDRKIASIGVAVAGWVTWHGLALNVSRDLSGFELIVSCGLRQGRTTSVSHVLGRDPDLALVKEDLSRCLTDALGFTESFIACSAELKLAPAVPCKPPSVPVPRLTGQARLPRWMRRPLPRQAGVGHVPKIIAASGLKTVCVQACCPNLPECFAQGRATFLILGDCCTRACRFCAIAYGATGPIDAGEPSRVAMAVKWLALRHVVVTSVTRDDLADGGAGQFVRTIHTIRQSNPTVLVEVLVPDFRGSRQALDTVLDAEPDVLAHNLETVRRLHPVLRPLGDYRRSLNILAWAAERASRLGLSSRIKSGLMAGLGESSQELLDAMKDLYTSGCRVLTLGQYLAPSRWHYPVVRFIPPEEFSWFRAQAEGMGFADVMAEPLARSSCQPRQGH